MNIKYWFEFKGLDDVLNRVEILTDSNVMPEEVHVPDGAFSLEYLTVKKLDVVQGSQVTLRLTSRKIFEFIGLHTDDMQEFMIRFYRAGRLYWLGFLDSELYSENLTDYPPYPVEFAGADFNIMKRLKYRDGAGNRYTDVAPFITHLKRCFDLLGLPFEKLYIGCTTVANDVPVSAGETALHVLYMMSANFYDEDNEPMTCREVVENILRPFGLMMVQKNGSVFIYDYNTVKLGLPMKRYNFSSFAYEAEETVNFDLGDISDIKTLTTDASFGFEEMINNVQIRSSLYGENIALERSIREGNLNNKIEEIDFGNFTKKRYRDCIGWDDWITNEYIVYASKERKGSIIGAKMPYDSTLSFVRMSFINWDSFFVKSDKKFYLDTEVSAYLNTRIDPFNEENNEAAKDKRTQNLTLHGDLLWLDIDNNPVMFYGYMLGPGEEWVDVVPQWHPIDKLERGIYSFRFTQHTPGEDPSFSGSIADRWNTAKGIRAELPELSGRPQLNFLWVVVDANNPGLGYYPQDKVKDILINDVHMSISDAYGNMLSTDDYIFKSYVNKKVATDFENIDLKCISANEENLPIGKANILKKIDKHYKLQLSFTRHGQTNILERLLMCTIHSNHTKKNVSISVTVKMTENPALTYCTYKNVIHSDGMYITGATLDFYNATATIKAEEFSADDARISDIPYD